MTEKSKKIIEEEMLNLPKEVQDAINAFSWEKTSEEIGKKYLLDENEINIFQLETASFLLGLVDEDLYPINIEEEVEISKNEAEKISEEVYQKIFNPIYDILSKNIEEKIKNKNVNWKQSLDFILSGGDYSVFIERKDNQNTSPEISGTNTLDNSSKIADIKNKFVI
jgi:hypothetical protein